MSLAAITFHDLCKGKSLAWRGEREGLVLTFDIITLCVLSILAYLVATEVLQWGPALWGMISVAIVIILADLISRVAGKCCTPKQSQIVMPTRRKVGSRNEVLPQSKTFPTPIEREVGSRNEVPPQSKTFSTPIVKQIRFPHQYQTHGLLIPLECWVVLRGDWSDLEVKDFDEKFRKITWTRSRGEYICYFRFKSISYGVASTQNALPTPQWIAEKGSAIWITVRSLAKSWGSEMTIKSSWIEKKLQGNRFQFISTSQPDFNCILSFDIVKLIFHKLCVKDQCSLIMTCTALMKGLADDDWYQTTYIPTRYIPTLCFPFLRSCSEAFQEWMDLCLPLGSVVYLDTTSEDPSIWDLKNFLPKIWPKGKSCVMGSIQNFYFCSVGVTLRRPGIERWGILTVFTHSTLVENNQFYGTILPYPLLEWEFCSEALTYAEPLGKAMTSRGLDDLVGAALAYNIPLDKRSDGKFTYVISPPPQPQ